MNKRDFLIEIGMEEIPSRFIPNAMTFLRNHYVQGLQEHNLQFDSMQEYSSPRRFALHIVNIPVKQQDIIEERVGPGIDIAYQNGMLSKAGQGFLKSSGGTEADVFIKETKKGKKIAVKKESKGKPASAILTSITTQLFNSFSFPKSMRWSHKNVFFARPVRWILMLWNEQILPFEWNGLSAGNLSYGNRNISLDEPIMIETIAAYEKELEKNGVIPDRTKRKREIEEMITSFYRDSDWKVVPNQDLINTVTDIVENPSVLEGRFEQRFLTLPEKVIINTLSEHQKYFAVKDAANLANKFLLISNGDKNYENMIRQGNEKVIKARLSDAEFYFREDTKQSFDSFVPKLKEVLFEAKLGSLLEKTERMIKIVAFIADKISLHTDIEINKQETIRSAQLAKADLVTSMLGEKEFTKLQGYIGMIYAGISGEPEKVCRAIFEHYLPRGKEDALPQSLSGAIVAIADKLDTVCGIIGSGRLPTGSNDPFAIRRATSGIVQILHYHTLPLELDELVQYSFLLYKEKFATKPEFYDFVLDYFKQRIIWFLQQQNIEHDVIKSVMHIDFYNVVDAIARAKDLQNFKQRDDFKQLVTGFKRVSNIIANQKKIPELKEELLQEKAEIAMYKEMKSLSVQISDLLQHKKYHELMNHLVAFSKTIDTFFDDVLVNTEEAHIRLNRLSLLWQIRTIFLNVADLAQIIIKEEKDKE